MRSCDSGGPDRGKVSGRPGVGGYVALAGEFSVLAELALRRLDGTLTLGHTKEIGRPRQEDADTPTDGTVSSRPDTSRLTLSATNISAEAADQRSDRRPNRSE